MSRYVAKDMYLKAEQLIGPNWIVENFSCLLCFSYENESIPVKFLYNSCVPGHSLELRK
jgi:hypothetical protein